MVRNIVLLFYSNSLGYHLIQNTTDFRDVYIYNSIFKECQNPDKEIRKECMVKSNEARYVNECGTKHT